MFSVCVCARVNFKRFSPFSPVFPHFVPFFVTSSVKKALGACGRKRAGADSEGGRRGKEQTGRRLSNLTYIHSKGDGILNDRLLLITTQHRERKEK